MTMDRRLNLFVSYNHDYIEDNLTRALIVTLRLLNDKTKHSLLKDIFSRVEFHEKSNVMQLFDEKLISIDFALQGNIELDKNKLRSFLHKYLITITGNNEFAEVEEYLDLEPHVEETLKKKKPPEDAPQKQLLKKLCSDSRPDAWIYDVNEEFVFLIESKTADAVLYYSQVIAHAFNWLGLTSISEMISRTIKIRWSDIINSIDSILAKQVSKTDEKLMNELLEYLEYNGFRSFKGFQWENLRKPSAIEIKINNFTAFRWKRLKQPPKINILARNN